MVMTMSAGLSCSAVLIMSRIFLLQAVGSSPRSFDFAIPSAEQR